MMHIASGQFCADHACPASKQSCLASCRDLWRIAPREMQREVLILTAAAPVLLAAFAALWIMVPA